MTERPLTALDSHWPALRWTAAKLSSARNSVDFMAVAWLLQLDRGAHFIGSLDISANPSAVIYHVHWPNPNISRRLRVTRPVCCVCWQGWFSSFQLPIIRFLRSLPFASPESFNFNISLLSRRLNDTLVLGHVARCPLFDWLNVKRVRWKIFDQNWHYIEVYFRHF